MSGRRLPPPGPAGLDPRIVKAISHPLRYQVLVRLNSGVASPSEIAREMGLPVGRVSHHVRALAAIGAIELVREEPRRGALEHYYRAVVPAWFSDDDWSRVPDSTRRAIGNQVAREVIDDVSAAALSGFAHLKAHLSFVRVELDEEGLDEMAELLRRTLEEVHAVEERSAGRDVLERASMEVVLMQFERPPD